MNKIVDTFTKYGKNFNISLIVNYIDHSGVHHSEEIYSPKFSFLLIPKPKNRLAYVYRLKEIVPYGEIFKITSTIDVYNLIKNVRKRAENFEDYSKMLYVLKKKLKNAQIISVFYSKKENRLVQEKITVNEFLEKFIPEKYYIANDFNLEIKFPKLYKFELAKFNDINLGFIDIEVATTGEFPNEKEAKFPVVSIAFIKYSPKFDSYTIYSYIYLDKNFTKVTKKDAEKYMKQLDVRNIEDYKDIFSQEEFKNKFQGFVYKIYEDERKMLNDFGEFLKKESINVITGWNSVSFDMKYLFFRSRRIKAKKFIDVVFKDEDFIIEQIEEVERKQLHASKTGVMEFYIPGIPNIDYKLLLESSFMKVKLNSYKLNSVAEEFLGLQKLNIGDLNEAYKNRFTDFIKYNILDVLLVLALEFKLAYINRLFKIREIAGQYSFYNLNINNVIEAYINTICNQMKNQLLFVGKPEAKFLNSRMFDIYLTVNNYNEQELKLLSKIL